MRFPSIKSVAKVLAQINREVDASDVEPEGVDVRLQVYEDGEWAVRWGLSDYDQDHRGHWGASSVPGGKRRFNSRETARDLIEQAKESHACERGVR